MIDRTMKTQTQNARGIDYDNYPVIPMVGQNVGWFLIVRPDGRNHNTYRDPDIARCDFRYYMEHYLDTPFGAR